MTDFNASGNWEDQIGTGGTSNTGGQTWQQQNAKPWYQNEAFAGAVAGGISGITNYLLEQERQRGQRSLQQDLMNWKAQQELAPVQRASTMPLLQRIVPNKKGLKPWPGIGGAYIK